MDDLPATELTASATERYRTLLEINNAVISNLTRDALFHAIADALRRVFSFERTAMFLHDPERDVLRLFVLESSLPSEYFRVGLEMAPGESHVGRVFREGRFQLRRDLEREREYPMEDRALADGVRAYVIVPLVARGTTIGTLAVASTTVNRYGEEDAVFLQEAASQIALAVANMQAHERISALSAKVASAAERYRLLLEVNDAVVSNLTRDALFEAIAGALRRLVPYERIAVLLHDPTRDALRLTVLDSTLPTQHFVVGWEQASQNSPAGWVRRHRQPLVRRDLAQERAYKADELSHAGSSTPACAPRASGRCCATGATPAPRCSSGATSASSAPPPGRRRTSGAGDAGGRAGAGRLGQLRRDPGRPCPARPLVLRPRAVLVSRGLRPLRPRSDPRELPPGPCRGLHRPRRGPAGRAL